MKNSIKYLFLTLMILFTACDRGIHVDYHTICYYYIDNKTDVDYFAEFEVNPSFGVNPQDTTLYFNSIPIFTKTI